VNVRFGGGRERVALRGRVTPPPDKSISHRAAIVGAMASAPVRVANYLDAADTRSTLQALRDLGAIMHARSGELVIEGVGMRNAIAPPGAIDVGNAGTLLRLLPGWLASQRGEVFTLDGDESIRRRPVDRIAVPLRAMGARLDAHEDRFAPFTVHGASLRGIDYELPVASAQVKACVLLAGLATEATTVREAVATRDHTERMLLAAGAPVERAALPGGGYASRVAHCEELEIESIAVPADMSSAAFLIAAGVLVPGSRLVLDGVGVNWTRAGFVAIARRMGAVVVGEVEETGAFGTAEPVCDLDVCAGPLAATTVAADEVPLAIDELPLVALLGCFAEGETVVRGAGELRVKESDRIATVVDGLRGLGADIEAVDDGFTVRGTQGLRGGSLEAHGDHRLALLGAVAGIASREGVEVVGMDAARVSYPGFVDDLASLSRL
jgi:3-phosphoshikimate 1-carboxyvinyltransferase